MIVIYHIRELKEMTKIPVRFAGAQRQKTPTPYSFDFRNRLLGGFEADLRMRPVAKRFLGGSAAAAECHSFFDWKLDSVGINQLHFTRHDVRTVFDCLDCYVSHR